MGCEAFGSDLNPVAGLLTWASLNLLGGGQAVQEEVMRVQADALAPSWLIGEKSKVIARWQRVPESDRLQPEIAVVSDAELKRYKDKKGATVVSSRVIDPFDSNRSWSVEGLRGTDGLRRWSNEDIVPRPGDVFQERLYCVRWVKTVVRNGKPKEIRRYAAPDAADFAREKTVLGLSWPVVLV